MSSPAERLNAIEAIYLDALSNKLTDMANAQTNVEAAAIDANLGAAQLAYYTAEAAALTNNNAEVENAYTAAQSALGQVKAARDAAAQIATLLGLFNGATGAATTLVQLAKSVGA